MKFGQLKKENIRNNFPEKPYTKYGGESITRPSPKKIKIEHIFG